MSSLVTQAANIRPLTILVYSLASAGASSLVIKESLTDISSGVAIEL